MFMDYDDTRNFAESVLLAIILNYTPEEMPAVYHNFFDGKCDKAVNRIVIHGITAVYNHEKKCWEKEKNEPMPMPICNDENATMPYETPKVNPKVDGMISVEWIKKYIDNRLVKHGDTWTFINCMINDWEKENM